MYSETCSLFFEYDSVKNATKKFMLISIMTNMKRVKKTGAI